jgi:arginine decarboxylase
MAGLTPRTRQKKIANRAKSTIRRFQGPVPKEQSAAQIGDAIQDYWDRGMLSFGIPAQSGGRGPAPDFAGWARMQASRADLPMSHGLDTRDRAWRVQTTAQELFAGDRALPVGG